MNREEKVNTRLYLLKEVANGNVLGPFTYNGQTHCLIDTGAGRKRNKLRGTAVFWTGKTKNEKEVGRFITDSTQSLLNADYTSDDVPCKLKSFVELVRDFNGAEAFAVCDFRAAYRQLHLEPASGWGLVTYLFEGKLYIDTRVHFGIVPGAGFFVTIANACAELYTYEKWNNDGTLPSRLDEIENTDGRCLRSTQSFHVDDGKYARTTVEVSNWIRWFCSLDKNDLGKRKALEWPLGKIPVQRGLYCGNIHDVCERACKVGDARRTKALRLAKRLDAGLPPRNDKPRPPFTLSKRELQIYSGTFENIASLHRCLKPSVIPIYRATDACTDDHTPKPVPGALIPWFKKASGKFVSILERNPWVTYESILGPTEAKPRANLVTDASSGWGVGAYCLEWNLCLQCPNEVFQPYLESWHDLNHSPTHINVAELLAPPLALFLAQELGRKVMDYQLWAVIDNTSAQAHLKKGRTKHPGSSQLADYTARTLDYHPLQVCHVSTEAMEMLGADALSRRRMSKFRNMNVILIDKNRFDKFWTTVHGNKYATFHSPPLFINTRYSCGKTFHENS